MPDPAPGFARLLRISGQADGPSHGGKQAPARKRLHQIGDRTGLLGLRARAGLVMGRDENDRRRGARVHQLPAQFEAGQAGQVHVQDQAVGAGGRAG